MIVLSFVIDIATHTCLKPIRMRFVCGQEILELKKKKTKEIQGKTSGKWRLPSIIMCMYNPKEYFSTRLPLPNGL